MKHLFYCICFSLINCMLSAQNGFITIWKTDNPSNAGTTSTQILYPNTGGTYILSWVNTADASQTGSVATTTANTIVDFGVAGTFEVTAKPTGTTTRMDFTMGTSGVPKDNQKLLEVKQWGSYTWGNILTDAFFGCLNMDVTAADKPLFFTNGTFSLSAFFYGCSNLQNTNGSIGTWETGNVINISHMFYGCEKFNQNLNSWKTDNVTRMEATFSNCAIFNQPLNQWNTSKVTTLRSTFYNCKAFNQNINSWNTALVTNMSSTFSNCTAFNQPLDNWKTGNVTRMESMFSYAENFNQDINSWDISKVTDLSFLFTNAFKFNQPLANWQPLSARNMQQLFNSAHAFNQPLNNWNVSSVTNMFAIFANAKAFDQPLDTWNVSNVTNLSSSFFGTTAFNQSLGSWNIGSATDIASMFNRSAVSCENYQKTLEGWVANPATPNNLTLGADGLKYGAAAQTARNELTTTKGWTIVGDSYDAACGGALPVVFGPISAKITDDVLSVFWKTMSEENNSHYRVEASTDGKDFRKIGIVQTTAVNGNSHIAIDYQFSKKMDSATEVLSLLVAFLLVGTGSFAMKQRKRGILTMFLAIVVFSGCNKSTELTTLPHSTRIYVRIVQVDKSGTEQPSKVVLANRIEK